MLFFSLSKYLFIFDFKLISIFMPDFCSCYSVVDFIKFANFLSIARTLGAIKKKIRRFFLFISLFYLFECGGLDGVFFPLVQLFKPFVVIKSTNRRRNKNCRNFCPLSLSRGFRSLCVCVFV